MFCREFDKAQNEGRESMGTFIESMAYLLGSHIPVAANEVDCGLMLMGVVNSVTDGMRDSMQALGSRGTLTKIIKTH
ncbi:hypothetical protein D3C74_490880 [compost metagenome]